MKTNFYRKLDLLNRCYVLNFGAPQELNQSALINMPQYLEHPVTQAMAYFNFADLPFLVAGLPRNKLNRLFRLVIVDNISRTPSIKLNGKWLHYLRQQLTSSELKQVLTNLGGPIRTTLNEELIEYSLEELVGFLLAQYFANLNPNLPSTVAKRFKHQLIPPTLEKSLIDMVNESVLLKTLRNALPNTYAVIQELKSNHLGASK
jgi:hypothetical protein